VRTRGSERIHLVQLDEHPRFSFAITSQRAVRPLKTERLTLTEGGRTKEKTYMERLEELFQGLCTLDGVDDRLILSPHYTDRNPVRRS
jgi:hypothetical protein